uniref:PEHE domain-containing protein n=1 Tax=Anopheles atroparvus TaxID=41427 RepID=A0AAG5DCQ3_ANOAO
MWLASTCAIAASTVSASDMMETVDDVVYCNSPTVTATVDASPDTPMPSAVVHESSSASDRSSPSLESVASSPSPSYPAPFSPAPSSPAPSSPAPVSIASSSPTPSSPAPSSPAPSFPAAPISPAPMYPALVSSPGPSSPAPSSPLPSSQMPMPMEYEPPAMMHDDEDEYDEGGDDDDEEDDVDEEYDADDGDNDGDDDYDDEDDDSNNNYNSVNIATDSAEVTDHGEDEDDHGGERRRDCFADSLIALKEVKQLQSILLLHLDLIQEQGDQILNKDKMIVKLRDENEVLKHQLDLSNKRLAMTLLQLQQNGLQFPLDLQQQQQLLLLQQPKPEGTVSPLTIRSQMENGRRRGVVLKSSSSSPPSVSSSFVENLYGQCLPIRNSEVSSTVSPAKEELGDELVLLQQHPYYRPPSLEDDEAAFIAENNEVDGEIYLNYSKSDDDESPSPATSYGEEEEDEEEEEEGDDEEVEEEEEAGAEIEADEEEAEAEEEEEEEVQEDEQEEEDDEDDNAEEEDLDGENYTENDLEEDEQEEQDIQGQIPLPLEQYDGMPEEEMEAGYESIGTAADEYAMQYVSVEQSHYEHAPMMMMMMMDDGAAEVGMDFNSQGSQESQDSQEVMQHAVGPAESDMAVNVQFVESTVGSEGEQPEGEEEDEMEEEDDEDQEEEEEDHEREDEEEDEEDQEEDIDDEEEEDEEEEAQCNEQQDDGAAMAAAPAMVGDQDTMETTYENNEPNEGEAGGESRTGFAESEPEAKDMQQHPFNPAVHCPSGNSSDGSVAKRSCKPSPAYMVTRKQYISCSWKDDAVTAELEKLLSNEAAELEIPSWNVIDDSSQSADDHVPTSRENISDEAYMKRHTKLEIDERRRKKWDVQRIREQKNIERLKKRQLKEQPADQEAQKTITTFYPTVDTLKYIVITDDVPVQAFGELIPLLPAPGSFSLPWHQPKANGGHASGQSAFGHASSQFPGTMERTHGPPDKHQAQPLQAGLLYETKTKFLHRLAPNLQAQKQRFTKRIKKEL